MANRRQFIRAGAAAAALPWLATSAGLADADPAQAEDTVGVMLHAAVFDDRYAEALAFAQGARTLGLPVHACHGDAAAVWRDHIAPLWRDQPLAIAGLTQAQPLAFLTPFAEAHGLRLVFRTDHAPRAGAAPLVSWMFAPPGVQT